PARWSSITRPSRSDKKAIRSGYGALGPSAIPPPGSVLFAHHGVREVSGIVVGERSVEEQLRATLAAVAPGTALRDGLERILRGRTGGLVVLGFDRVVEELCTGGFALDIEFSATRLRELAKMDGAIVTDGDVSRILR